MRPAKNLWEVYKFAPIPVIATALGMYLNRLEDERMSQFRDKSALYGRTLAPGEAPSWP